MAGHLFPRADLARLASDVVTDELVTTASLASNRDLLSPKPWHQADGCIIRGGGGQEGSECNDTVNTNRSLPHPQTRDCDR